MNIRTLAAVLVLAAAPVLSAGPAAAADKAPEMPAGYRALTLPFAAHQLLFVKPGDRVDILVTFNAELGEKEKARREDMTATIMQNVIVLAVSQPAGVAQFMFNPNEAQYAALFAAKDKTLWISKRGPGDTEMHPMEMAAATKLFR